MSKIKIFKTSELSPDLKAKKADLDARCFHIVDLVDHENNYFRKPKYDLFVMDDHKLLSAIEIYEISATWHEQPFVIAGVGSVMTDEAARGRGLAKSLLAEAVKIMRSERYDFALLQTNIEQGIGLYGSIGFIPMKKICNYHKKDGEIGQMKAKDTMILPLTNQKVVDEIMSSDDILDIGDGGF